MEGKDWTMVSFAPSGPVAISEKEGDYGLYLLSGIGWQYLIPSLLWARKKVLYCLYCRNELNSLAVSVHIEVHFYSHFSASFLNSREFKMLLLLLLFNCSVLSISLWSHGLQHARLLCPSPSPRVCSNSGPLSRWCYLTISSSVVHFSSCPQSFRASGSFPVSQLFTSGGQSIRVSASGEYSMNIQDCISFRMDWLDLLAVQGTLKSLLQHHNSKASILRHSAFFIVQLAHPYMTIGKTIALTRRRQSGNFTPQHLGWEQQRKEYCEIVSCMDYFNENNRGIYF